MQPKPVVVIGGGHAGAQFVASLRQEGYSGPLLMISDDISLPYHKPPLSKAWLKNPEEDIALLRQESFYRDNDIGVRIRTQVKTIEREQQRVVLASGETIDYASLVLATGVSPRRLTITGVADKDILVLRTLADAQQLLQRSRSVATVCIVGGGFVGLEVASTLAEQGHDVTVVEAASRLLARSVAPQVSDYIHHSLRARGVGIFTDVTITSGDSDGGELKSVTLTSGEVISTELVIAGIGVTINDELALAADLECDNGIRVDQAMRASDPNIYAIGDCTNYDHWLADRAVRLESVQNASDQARVAASVIAGAEKTYRAVPWFWSEIGDARLQMVGLSFDADDYIEIGSRSENSFSVFHFSGERLVAIDSVNRPMDHMLGRKFMDANFSPTKQDVREGSQHLKTLFNDFKRGQ